MHCGEIPVFHYNTEISVEKAIEFNRHAISEGRAVIEQSDVLGMPFRDEMFSLVTAIETVYFWDRIEECYARLFRSIMPGGRIALVCEAWRDATGNVNEPDGMDILRLNLYSPKEFAAALTNAGFINISTQEITPDRCLCVLGWRR